MVDTSDLCRTLAMRSEFVTRTSEWRRGGREGEERWVGGGGGVGGSGIWASKMRHNPQDQVSREELRIAKWKLMIDSQSAGQIQLQQFGWTHTQVRSSGLRFHFASSDSQGRRLRLRWKGGDVRRKPLSPQSEQGIESLRNEGRETLQRSAISILILLGELL